MSRKWVPWPGKRTSSTEKPRCASSSAKGRSDAGLPVKPCAKSTPIRARSPEPFEDHGSAPGNTGKVTSATVHETRDLPAPSRSVTHCALAFRAFAKLRFHDLVPRTFDGLLVLGHAVG